LALSAAGRVFAFGAGNHGQLGVGPTGDQLAPALVPAFADPGSDQIVQVAAGWDYSLALTEHGRVYAFGADDFGQLGLGSTGDQLEPVLVPSWSDPGSDRIVRVVAGYFHSFAVSAAGRLYTSGYNDYGQLGLDWIGDQWAPQALSVPRLPSAVQGSLAPAAAAQGAAVAVAVTTSGAVGQVVPSGRVSVAAGAAQASGTLDGQGRASVTLNLGTMAAGAYPVSVTYDGDDVFAGAAGSAGTLQVTQATQPPDGANPADPGGPTAAPAPAPAPGAAWRSVAGSKAVASLGGGGKAKVSLKVSGRKATTASQITATVTVLGPTATSKVKANRIAYRLERASVAAKATVKAGKAKAVRQGKGASARAGLKRTVTFSGLAPGTYTLRLGYIGDGVIGDAQASAVRIKVTKAKPKVTVTAPTRVAPSSKAKVTVKVAAGALKATGKVTVTWAKGKSKTVTLKAKAKGKATFKLPKLSRGTYTLKVAYTGSDRIAKKTVRKRLTVAQARQSSARQTGPTEPVGPEGAGSLLD
jgi:hypothetical protein